MAWFWFAFAFLIANAAALCFYFALGVGGRWRTVIWLACSGVIVLSSTCVPIEARPLRFLDSVAAVTLLWKVYDAYREPTVAIRMGVRKWVAYLPNWFWFVLKRVPRSVSAAKDWQRVAVNAPLTVASVTLFFGLLRIDWSGIPFLLEHTVKVLAITTVMLLVGRTSAALFRRLVGPATEPIENPFAARTPAEFWRRWNRPFRDFFDQYVFRPLGGMRRPVIATFAVFGLSGLVHEYIFGISTGRVQGWQMLFFLSQGCMVVATLRIQPRGRVVLLWWASTLAFNLATSVLFFRSVNEVIAFYQR